MYKVIHIDPNGCEYHIGIYATEKGARLAAEDHLRTHCSLYEQIDHFIEALNIPPGDSISEVIAILRQSQHEPTPEIHVYCEDFNDNTKDVMRILGPNDFDVCYWPDLSYDEMRGFYYEICSNS